MSTRQYVCHGTATAGLVVIMWGAESAVFSSPATGLEELKPEKLLKLELSTTNLQCKPVCLCTHIVARFSQY